MQELRNVGLGGSIFRESIGPQNQTQLAVDASYIFKSSILRYNKSHYIQSYRVRINE